MNHRRSKLAKYGIGAAGVTALITGSAEAALQVIDLSGLGSIGSGTFIDVDNDAIDDAQWVASGAGTTQALSAKNGATLYGDLPVLTYAAIAYLYQNGDTVDFPTDPDTPARFFDYGGTFPGGAAFNQTNWVAMKSTSGKIGWLAVDALTNNELTIAPNRFVFETTASTAADGPDLQPAVNAPIPEPSALSLLTLGAAGLLARRRERK